MSQKNTESESHKAESKKASNYTISNYDEKPITSLEHFKDKMT
jgi:hypothetical protein